MKRQTKQRTAVAELLQNTDEFRTAQQLYAQLRGIGTHVGLTTVYRSLAMMAESGEVDVILGEDGEARYRSCSTNRHHHHIVCRQCGFAVEVEAAGVERWAQRTAAEHGFGEVTHTVEIMGLCDTCQRKPDVKD